MPKSKNRFIFVRIFAWLIGLVIAVCVVIPIAFLAFFNPNDYKAELSQLIQDKTHLPIAIEGPITLHYFPWLGFAASDISLPQPQGFEPGTFLKAKIIEFKIPLRALLRGQCIIEALRIDGLSLHLIEQTNGKTNLSQIIAAVQSAQEAKPNEKSVEHEIENNTVPKTDHKTNPTYDNNEPKNENRTSEQKSLGNSLSLSLEQFDIEHATIRYDDQKTHQSAQIHHLNFTGTPLDNFSALAFSTSALFMLDANEPTLNLEGDIKSKGKVFFGKDPHLQTALMGSLKAKDLPATWQSTTFAANVIADAKHIAVNNLDVKSASHAKGAINIPMDPQKPIEFQLVIDALNADQLPIPATPTAQNKPAKSVSGSEKTTVGKSAAASAAAPSRKLKGDITIGQVTMQPYRVSNIHATILKNGSMLTISPLTADLYEGKLQMALTKNIDNATIPMQLNGRVTGLDLKSVIDALKQPIPITGKAALDFQLQYTPTAPIQGAVQCKLTQGTLQGVDVNYYLQLAGALLKGEPKTNLVNTKSSTFDSLTATLKLHDNIIDNNDLNLMAPDFSARGEGSVFLTPQTISYKLQVKREYHDGKEHPNALPLAIRIKGSLKDPTVEPDLDVYLKTKVKKEISKEVNKQIQKQVDKQLQKYLKIKPPETPGATPDNTDSGTTDNPPADPLQEAVEKNIKKGLKKLFKK